MKQLLHMANMEPPEGVLDTMSAQNEVYRMYAPKPARGREFL